MLVSSSKRKFDNIDVIFNSSHIIFFVTPVIKTASVKEYEVYVPKNNKEEIDKIARKTNSILSNKTVEAMFDPEFKALSDKLNDLSKELEKVGEIKCRLNTSGIEVEVSYQEREPKKFLFKDDEYLDTLIDYLSTDYKKLIFSNY